ncbi:hypothetical protein [Flavisolibacter ginsenosidimutans]|uniref:Uncharacterized protein n=1 Tax=Flavisolibacter ginsenosidimutans TaxID=661481 RepID=A0A5B8UIA0_9BACT|nr:hypothetical protein [Flavisolibacter ginsenosidimutans]QEC56253.1 hypothetical protein FSB75_10240 [Flavisolibacter ginsenosidimutans]
MIDLENKFELPLELPEPWYWTSQALTEQLQKEISSKHLLYGKQAKTIARRQDNDDVLFQLSNNDYGYAVVHLTWSEYSHADGKYPKTILYKDWQDVYTNRILMDKAEFEL